ncbi:MAG: type II toxin-antitoxin system PemK/MazF family toxin [Geitlerinemataceae cyanobacterium]
MKTDPKRGEIRLVDLGYVAKVRPCLVLNIPIDDCDRAITSIIPHTTQLRDSRFEVPVKTPYLKPGAFNAQGINTIPNVKLIRKLGTLDRPQLEAVEQAVRLWLDLQ